MKKRLDSSKKSDEIIQVKQSPKSLRVTCRYKQKQAQNFIFQNGENFTRQRNIIFFLALKNMTGSFTTVVTKTEVKFPKWPAVFWV